MYIRIYVTSAVTLLEQTSWLPHSDSNQLPASSKRTTKMPAPPVIVPAAKQQPAWNEFPFDPIAPWFQPLKSIFQNKSSPQIDRTEGKTKSVNESTT